MSGSAEAGTCSASSRAAYWNEGMEKEAAQEWEIFHQLAGNAKTAHSIHQAFQRGGAKGVFEFQLRDDLPPAS